MPRKPRMTAMWKQMSPASLRRLAVAVFFIFATIGPLSVLMESKIREVSWSFLIVQTIASGGLAASIVLFWGRKWWISTFVIIFWVMVTILNSGAFGFVFDDKGFRVQLNGLDSPKHASMAREGIVLSPDQLSSIYTQRSIVGVVAIVLLSVGYALFIKVVREEIQQRSRLETEVNIARDIQQSLLPSTSLDVSWCSIAGMTIPATEVGGDYFDIVQLSERIIAVAIADVTGHGVGAGILSAMTKSALYSQMQHDASPRGLLKNLNKTLYDVSDEKTFVTFAYALLDASNQTVRITTAGHPPVFYKKSGSSAIEHIRMKNIGLGIKSEMEFQCGEYRVGPGDMFLLYTDGVMEASSAGGEQFGVQRLEDCFLRATGSSSEVCTNITSDLRQFCRRDVFDDDVSLVCIKFS